MTPTESKCCSQCRQPVYNNLTNAVMYYKCANSACRGCHSKAKEAQPQVCGVPYYAYAYTPEGDTDTVTQYCENPLPCPDHKEAQPEETDGDTPSNEEYVGIEEAQPEPVEWEEEMKDRIAKAVQAITVYYGGTYGACPVCGLNPDRFPSYIADIIATQKKKAYEEAYRAGLAGARGVVPEDKTRPLTFSRSEETYNEGLENGWNACKDSTLAAIDLLMKDLP